MSLFLKFLTKKHSSSISTKQWLFFALIISAVIGPGISYKMLYLFHIVLVLNLIYLLLFNLKNTILRIKEMFSLQNKMNYFFLFTIVVFLIWIPFVEGKYYAFRHFAFISIGFLLTVLIIEQTKNLKDLNFLFRSVVFIYLIDISLAILEALRLVRWPISRLSYYNHLFGRENEIESILNKTEHHTYVYSMPTTFHWNPNDFATFALFGLPFFLFSGNFLISTIGVTTITTIIVAAGSKSAFLGVIIILIASLFFIKKRLKNILVLILITAFYSTNGFSLLQNKSLKLDEVQAFVYNGLGIELPEKKVIKKVILDPNEYSNNDRVDLIKRGFELFKENPLFGVGGGNSQYIMEKEGGVGYHKLSNLHNFWLELLVEGGGLFFLVFILWCTKLVLSFIKNIKNQLKIGNQLYYLNASTLLAMLGLIISGIGPSSMISFFPLYLFLGLALSVYFVTRNYENSASIRH